MEIVYYTIYPLFVCHLVFYCSKQLCGFSKTLICLFIKCLIMTDVWKLDILTLMIWLNYSLSKKIVVSQRKSAILVIFNIYNRKATYQIQFFLDLQDNHFTENTWHMPNYGLYAKWKKTVFNTPYKLLLSFQFTSWHFEK